MENANKYAQLRLTIAKLEAEAKELETVLISEIQSQEKKNVETDLGKVTLVETKIYKYSDEFVTTKKVIEDSIKEYAERVRTPLEIAKQKEEENQTPEIKIGLRFTANK